MLKEKTAHRMSRRERAQAGLFESLFKLGYPRWQTRSVKTALRSAALKRFRAGEVVIREGDPPAEVYIVRAGSLRIETLAAGIVAEVGPGDIVGEAGLMTLRPRTATVIASRDCELYILDHAQFGRLLHSSQEFRRKMERLARERRPRPSSGA